MSLRFGVHLVRASRSSSPKFDLFCVSDFCLCLDMQGECIITRCLQARKGVRSAGL